MDTFLNLASPKGHEDLEIVLDHHYTSKVYGTGSHVSGKIIISVGKDLVFDSVKIIFTCEVLVRIQEITLTSRTTQRLLSLEMPISDISYPFPKILTTGQPLSIPFKFIIPNNLTTEACRHDVCSESVREHHQRLPPTMGDWEEDDMSPVMSRIDYKVKAFLMKPNTPLHSESKPIIQTKTVRVLPTYPEDPPLGIVNSDTLYKLEISKTLRHALFSASTGQVRGLIKATATQPNMIRLNAVGRGTGRSFVLISLTFEPSSVDVAPPVVSSAHIAIESQTWFSKQPEEDLPNRGTPAMHFPATVSLGTTDLQNSRWEQHVDLDWQQNPRATRFCPVFYTAAINLPFALPSSEKTFLPTFSSCLVSRTYTVKVKLTIDKVGINIVVPLQIAVEKQDVPGELDDDLPSFDAATNYWGSKS